jgi:hypothetical protein
MVVTPGVTPVIIPDDTSIVATPGLVLLQAPPPVASLNVAEEVPQIFTGPVIGPMLSLTVTGVMVMPQPDDNV